MVKITAFCDDYNEFRWFIGLAPEFQSAQFERIEARGKNPPVIENLIRYDRPDVILLIGGRPVLVLEKTREVPTGHNVGQRMGRLVRAVELGVPTIKFFPFDARKHGVHSSICNLNARLLLAFEQMSVIHETPTVAVNWPSNESGELLDDSRADRTLSDLLQQYVASGFDRDCAAFYRARVAQREEYKRRCEVFAGYGEPPPSLTIENTQDALARLGADLIFDGVHLLARRQESVVYEIGMTESKCRRTDPYTGTQFIYDYIYCRTGSGVEDKRRNLILHFPKIRQQVWERENPDDSRRKSCNWYLTANALVFSDGQIVLR